MPRKMNPIIYPIGTKVSKNSPKPFKSGLKINTIKSITTHPTLNLPAYTFEEDTSIVETRRCILPNSRD